MFYEETLEELSHEVKADKTHAQLLIKMTDSSRSAEEAEKIIEGLGVHVVEKSRLSTYWVLFTLNVRDMRDAALKLTEHGFNVKGINALP